MGGSVRLLPAPIPAGHTPHHLPLHRKALFAAGLPCTESIRHRESFSLGGFVLFFPHSPMQMTIA